MNTDSPPQVHLRLLREQDLGAAQSVYDGSPVYHRHAMGREAPSDMARRCFEQTPPKPKKGVRVFKRFLGVFRGADDGQRGRAVRDEEIVGVIDVFVGYPAYHIATIGTFIIRESLQRVGFGSAAMAALRDWLGDHHPAIEWIDCSILDDNHGAARFLLAHGFERTDSWHEVEVAGETRRVIRLERRLKGT